MEKMILSRNDVCELLGISSTTLWRWRSIGLIPAPFKLGPDGRNNSKVAWYLRDIEKFLREREAASQKDEAAA